MIFLYILGAYLAFLLLWTFIIAPLLTKDDHPGTSGAIGIFFLPFTPLIILFLWVIWPIRQFFCKHQKEKHWNRTDIFRCYKCDVDLDKDGKRIW